MTPHIKFDEILTSRFTHDLANPLGAIGNGIELLELTGVPDSPEFQLLKDSFAMAKARLRLMRVAFGDPIDAPDLIETWGKCQRCNLILTGPDDAENLRLATLLAMCLESAMPMAGDITLSLKGPITAAAVGRRVLIKPDAWAIFDMKTPSTPAASDAHFVKLAQILQHRGQALKLSHDDTTINVTIANN